VIYEPQAHIELLSRSNEFFKYIISSMPLAKLKLLWETLLKYDDSAKDIMFKMLNDCSKKVKNTHI
jgi:hypothetical protein